MARANGRAGRGRDRDCASRHPIRGPPASPPVRGRRRTPRSPAASPPISVRLAPSHPAGPGPLIRPFIHPRTTRPAPSSGSGRAAEIDGVATHASAATIGQTHPLHVESAREPAYQSLHGYLARNSTDVLSWSLIHSASTPGGDLSTATGPLPHTEPGFVHARTPPVHSPINTQTATSSGVPTRPTTTSCVFRLTATLRRRIVSGSLRTIRAASSETPAGPKSPARQPRNTHQSIGRQGERRSYGDEHSSGPVGRSKA